MKTHWFHILLALAVEPRHGLAIMRDVSEQTAGGVKLWPAMLYGSLDRMTRNGWIAPLEGGERPEGESERKRYYRITELGAAELERETAIRCSEMVSMDGFEGRRSVVRRRRTPGSHNSGSGEKSCHAAPLDATIR